MEVGDAGNPEKSGNYEQKIGQRKWTRTEGCEAYEANTGRVRQLICFPSSGVRQLDTEFPDWETEGWEPHRQLISHAFHDLGLSFLVLLTLVCRVIAEMALALDRLERNVFLSPAQEESSSKGEQSDDLEESSMESLPDPFRSIQSDSDTSTPESRIRKRSNSSDIADETERGPVDSPVKKKPFRPSNNTSEPSSSEATLDETPVATPTAEPTFTMAAPPFRFPLPMPGSEGTPLFKGYNVTDFIERFEFFCENYSVPDRKATLPKYCDSARREIVTSLAEYDDKSKTWEDLVDVLKGEFRSDDRFQATYSLSFLTEFTRMDRSDGALKDYCRQFASVSKYLVDKGILSEVDQGRLFLLGLPRKARERVLSKHKVDDGKPETYKHFALFRTSVEEFARIDETNRALEQQRDPPTSLKKELHELVQERGQERKVPDELKKLPPVARGTGLNTDAKLDDLVEGFKKLSIEVGRLRDPRSRDGSRAEPYQPSREKGPELYDYRNPAQQVLNVNPMSTSRGQYCLYCFDPSHWRRDCPSYLQDFEAGVCHVDYDGKLCLGPRNPNAKPANLRGGPGARPQGE
jgi:hypothetical protein